ncbi:MAG: SMP-30/gluconolactonase/LRE family protein [Desulfuromonadales bacterium]|nr:SMP-30/gluconolactonase/LRE family protein [Desulfuromonadales bacterium]
MLTHRISTYLLIGLLLSAVLPAVPGRADSTDDVRLFWPPPPNAPRMEFVGVIESVGNLKVKWQQIISDQAIRRDAKRLNYPSAVAPLADGRLLIAEAFGKTVQRADFANGKIEDLLAGGQTLQEPIDIATDSQGTIYLVDREARKVYRYDAEMQPLAPLTAPIAFSKPEKIALNEARQLVYVSDSILNRILAFSLQGEFLFIFGNGENELARLSRPHGMAVDADGNLYVADTGNARIQVYDHAGNVLRTFPFGKGANGSALLAPWDLTFDQNSNLHIIDRDLAAVITCRSDGRILYVTGASERTNHLLGFNRPVDLQIDAANRMYIADDLNRRVTVWQLFSDNYLAANPIEEDDVRNLLTYRDYLHKHRGHDYFTRGDVKTVREKLQASYVEIKPDKSQEIPLIVGQRVLACPMCNNPNRVFIDRDDIDLLLRHAAHTDDLKTGGQVLLGQRVVLCSFCGSDIPVTVTFKEASGTLTLATPTSTDRPDRDASNEAIPARQPGWETEETTPVSSDPPQAAALSPRFGQSVKGADL